MFAGNDVYMGACVCVCVRHGTSEPEFQHRFTHRSLLYFGKRSGTTLYRCCSSFSLVCAAPQKETPYICYIKLGLILPRARLRTLPPFQGNVTVGGPV